MACGVRLIVTGSCILNCHVDPYPSTKATMFYAAWQVGSARLTAPNPFTCLRSTRLMAHPLLIGHARQCAQRIVSGLFGNVFNEEDCADSGSHRSAGS